MVKIKLDQYDAAGIMELELRLWWKNLQLV
jgi:hypothetical protein